jgi:heat shock protein HslJ
MTMALLLGAALAVAGAAAQAEEAVKLTDKSWTLTEFGGESFAPKPSGNAHVIFRANGKFSGYAFCNSMFSSYASEGGKLTIKPIGITMRACVDPADNDREQAFLKALREVRGWQIEGDRLALLDEKGTVVARFVAEPQ